MPANIKNNNILRYDLHLLNDKYYDYMLYKGDCEGDGCPEECNAASIDFTKVKDVKDRVYSNKEWGGAVNEGAVLKNIGLTGVDNGFIHFRKDLVSNEEFIKIYSDSEEIISEGEKKLFLSPITGNTMDYIYPMEKNEDGSIALKGGFYQGFFKLYGFDYQTLPDYIKSDWLLSFDLRKRDYDILDKTLNKEHPENDGIFFFMGTRAENKFSFHYNKEDKDFVEEDSILNGLYYTGTDGKKGYNDYNEDQPDDNPFFDFEFFTKDIDLNEVKVNTSEGHDIDKRGYFNIKTDNKFLLFNHTEDGFTTENWDGDADVVLTGRTVENDRNLFELMNHTSTGYTTENINEYIENNQKDYDVYKDIRNNVFALRMVPKMDGDKVLGYNIGYRYGVLDCDEKEHNYSVIEENSDMRDEFLIQKDEWSKVDVRLSILNGAGIDECDPMRGKRSMKIYIYVNGNLVLVSKELPELAFRNIKDIPEKQEAVPYNISVGGGSQGLADMIWKNFYARTDKILPIEKDFAGTFIGDIKGFGFNECMMDYNDINKR